MTQCWKLLVGDAGRMRRAAAGPARRSRSRTSWCSSRRSRGRSPIPRSRSSPNTPRNAGTSTSRPARLRPARRSPTGASSNGRAGPMRTSSGAARARSSTSSRSRSCWRSSICRKACVDSIPASIGKPKPIPLKDPNGFWIGTVLEPYGLVYHPKVLARLGVPAPKDWDDLLHPKLKGNVAQCAPTRSSSSHATYEVILQRDGDAKGWEWLKRLAGQYRALYRAQP